MKCKCSLDNTYEVIGLCDLNEFNRKISEFQDKSWSEINFSKILSIDDNKPPIKKITKTYLNIKITSNKIVDTLSSRTQNIEGFNLTGKILLVSGVIYQKILYLSDINSIKTHSIKLKDNFTTSIILDEDANMEFSKYFIYPFIEDISLKPISYKKIYRSITLFFFTRKIDIPVPINNEFVFYNHKQINPEEIVRVSFNGIAKSLTVTSTGTPYSSLEQGDNLEFELKDSSGRTTKAKGIVKRNQDGSEFVQNLNNQKFETGDLIFLTYQMSKNTVLTNYPSVGSDYYMTFMGNDIFKIKNNEVVPYTLPNVILLKSINGEEVLGIGFDVFLKDLVSISPSTATTNPAYRGREYFKIIVKSSNPGEKYSASIQGDQNGHEIANNLLNKGFEYGDIIELIYQEGQRVEITNNPYLSSTKYTLTGTTQSFRITEKGLIKV